MAEQKYWFIDSDNYVKLIGLRDAKTLAYDNAATVTMTLYKESDDVAVTGVIDLVLAYVAASDGDYEGTIPDTITLSDMVKYYLLITVDGTTYQLKLKYTRTASYYPYPNADD